MSVLSFFLFRGKKKKKVTFPAAALSRNVVRSLSLHGSRLLLSNFSLARCDRKSKKNVGRNGDELDELSDYLIFLSA